MDKTGSKEKKIYWSSKLQFLKLILVLGVIAFFSISIIFGGSDTFAFADEFPTVVTTEYGQVEGHLSANNTLAWKGIPFAKPPVGDLRWKRPDDPDPWSGVKKTDEFCGSCTQYVEFPPGSQNFFPSGSEDCLYLNVWRPNSEETDLPVYFYIHGGGNSIGTAGVPIYDGSNVASNGNLIVVTTNYRLGPLGWFTHPVLRKGKKGTVMSDSGNYGTLDIIMALKWVRENIEAFGGDRDNVTISGLSAGGTNVISLLISPAAAGLFHKAFSQSGPPGTSTVEIGDARADEVINALMANDGIVRDGMKDNQIADYLRSKTAYEILSVYTPWAFGMINPEEFPACFEDGIVIHEAGYPGALLSGEYNQVPIILGCTKEEHKMFMLDLLYQPGAPPYVLQMNPCEYQQTAELINDIYWQPVTVDSIAQLLTLHQPGDVFAYQFLYGANHYDLDNDCEPMPGEFNAWPDFSMIGGPNFALWFGALHSLDSPFFFGNYFFLTEEVSNLIFSAQNSPGYELLSNAMIDYVSQFAHTGDPGDAGGEDWIPWSNTQSGPRILFDADEDETLIEMSAP